MYFTNRLWYDEGGYNDFTEGMRDLAVKCRKCGTQLLDTDTFCLNCGTKVCSDVCPQCGETLRQGTRFCHHCGAAITSDDCFDEDIPIIQQRTVDIPFEQIEQGILYEAQKVAGVPSRGIYQESDEDFEDEELDEESEEADGKSVFSKVTTILAILILFFAVTVGLVLWKKYGGGQDLELSDHIREEVEEHEEDAGVGTLQIKSNVNVRNLPQKEQSEVLFVAKTGEAYNYYNVDENGWYQILIPPEKANGETGYVYGEYVEIISSGQ